MTFDRRSPEVPVRVVMNAIRRHVEALKREWDEMEAGKDLKELDEVDTYGPSVMLDEARTWVHLQRYRPAAMNAVLRPNVGCRAVRSRPRERRSRRVRSCSRSHGDPDPPEPSDLAPSQLAAASARLWARVRRRGAKRRAA
jgi:hypothetical protein